MFLDILKQGGDTMIVRTHYLNTLKNYRDVPLVKILAGIRRSGKSTILDMLKDVDVYSEVTGKPLQDRLYRYILGKRSKRHYFNSSPKGNLPIMVVIIVGDKYIC